MDIPTPPRIVVVNPNSLKETTRAIELAVAGLRTLAVDIVCHTSEDGPPGIQTQNDVDAAVPPLLKLADGLADEADAMVVACFSDPGLHSLRERLHFPVLGIGESAMLVALTVAQRVGVIAIAQSCIARHYRYFSGMGIMSRLAGERSLDMRMQDLADDTLALPRLIEVGKALKEEDGAGALVLGCAGMANLRRAVEDATGIAVIEPTAAAVSMAVGRIYADKSR